MKETHAFRNPKFPGQRITVDSDGIVRNSRTRQVLGHADVVGSVAWYEFAAVVERLNSNTPYARPQRKESASE